MKNVFLLLIVFTGFRGFSQNYNFNEGTQVYTELSSPTLLTDQNVWDDPVLTVPLGMNVNFLGTATNTLYFSDYGLGTFLTTSPNDEGIHPVLDVFTSDICDRAYTDDEDGVSVSTISYEAEGTVGERIFKIQWKNVGFLAEIDSLNTSTHYANFQLWLYEDSERFDIVYGNSDVANWILEDDICAVILSENYNFDDEEIGNPKILHGNINNPIFENFNENIEFGFNVVPTSGTVYSFGYTVSLDEIKSEINIYQKENILFVEDLKNDLKSDIYKLYSINGKLIRVGKINSSIDLLNLNKGSYFLVLNTEQGEVYKKFIK